VLAAALGLLSVHLFFLTIAVIWNALALPESTSTWRTGTGYRSYMPVTIPPERIRFFIFLVVFPSLLMGGFMTLLQWTRSIADFFRFLSNSLVFLICLCAANLARAAADALIRRALAWREARVNRFRS
jgi:hypothetical protein